MNNELQKNLIATHNQVDPSMVTATAQTLIKSWRNGTIYSLAISRGYIPTSDDNDFNRAYVLAMDYLVDLITLPEDKPQTIPAVVYRKGEPPFIKQYQVIADYQDLPFSEPINGVEQ